jgi:hypothetical protein
MEMKNLYEYVFWCNTYTNIWHAIPKDQYQNFMSGYLEYEGVIKSPNMETLLWMINHPEEANNILEK